MTLQITLIFIGVLLAIMIGLLIWVVRITIDRSLFVKPEKTTSLGRNQDQQSNYTNPVKLKYANSKLKPAVKEVYVKKILEALELHKVYRQSDLTIKRFAQEIGLPKHHLSQIINEQLGTNFLDLINRYRVEDAKAKLQADSLDALSILAIGQQVGFHAKSTFYAAFKKYTNQTPSAFRKAGKRKMIH